MFLGKKIFLCWKKGHDNFLQRIKKILFSSDSDQSQILGDSDQSQILRVLQEKKMVLVFYVGA